jgi:hypothetical protein
MVTHVKKSRGWSRSIGFCAPIEQFSDCGRRDNECFGSVSRLAGSNKIVDGCCWFVGACNRRNDVPNHSTVVATTSPARHCRQQHDAGPARVLFAQTDSAIPMPFLAVLLFWLAAIFVSFGLFARPNAMVVSALFVCALSAASAIFLILELGHPFSGLMEISSAPLSNALLPLGP